MLGGSRSVSISSSFIVQAPDPTISLVIDTQENVLQAGANGPANLSVAYFGIDNLDLDRFNAIVVELDDLTFGDNSAFPFLGREVGLTAASAPVGGPDLQVVPFFINRIELPASATGPRQLVFELDRPEFAGDGFDWAAVDSLGVSFAHLGAGSQIVINRITLETLPDLTADYDDDGVVDSADWEFWRDSFGTSPSLPGMGADGNGDGFVDTADYTVWRDAFAVAQAATAVAVPEPQTLTLLACLAPLGLRQR